jgi:outer membrane protein
MHGLLQRIVCVLALLCGGAAVAQTSFKSAVDMALASSDRVKVAEAEEAHALAALSEVKDAYVPSLSFSSGLAKGTGFPPGDPSTFKITAQGLVMNSSQPQFVRAAREGWRASVLATENARQQVILDTALTYFELQACERQAAVLQEEEDAANRLTQIMQDRESAGLESKLTLARTRLRAAQTRLKRLDVQTRADVLTEHLASLTGADPQSLRKLSDSIPAFPALLPPESAKLSAVDANLGLKSAYQEAKSKQYFAKGQHKVNFRPEIDLLLQYGYLYDFNDYSQYYSTRLPPSNAVAGVQISVPLFNRAQDAKAREADADAVKAVHQADLQRLQVNENVVQLRRALEQTDAQAEVARLQHEISADNLQALDLRAQQGGDNSAAAITPADTEGAKIEERGLLADSIEADFEHTKAELEWMNLVGTLDDWAGASVKPTAAAATHIQPAAINP